MGPAMGLYPPPGIPDANSEWAVKKKKKVVNPQSKIHRFLRICNRTKESGRVDEAQGSGCLGLSRRRGLGLLGLMSG